MEFLNWFLNPVRNQYADFEGRATRQEYWMFVLISFLLAIVIMILSALVGTPLLYMLFWFAIIVPNFAIIARRLHDINMSGWWQLIALVPMIGSIILIVFLAMPAKDEGNTYGVGVPVDASDTPAQPVSDAEVVAQEVQTDVIDTQQEQVK